MDHITKSQFEILNNKREHDLQAAQTPVVKDRSLAELYPKYYKAIPEEWGSIDVYGVCELFPIKDNSGCIHHAVKKLLVPGVRTGGKSFRDDIREARDTLNRWLQLNPE